MGCQARDDTTRRCCVLFAGHIWRQLAPDLRRGSQGLHPTARGDCKTLGRSMFAWHGNEDFDPSSEAEDSEIPTCGLFTEFPQAFEESGDFVPCKPEKYGSGFSINNIGLQVTLPGVSFFGRNTRHTLLECQMKQGPSCMVVIPLLRIHKNLFVRTDSRYTSPADRAAWRWCTADC